MRFVRKTHEPLECLKHRLCGVRNESEQTLSCVGYSVSSMMPLRMRVYYDIAAFNVVSLSLFNVNLRVLFNAEAIFVEEQ